MKLSAAEVTIIRTIRCTAGGIPEAGAFFILAYGTTRTGGVFSQLRTRFAVVVFGRCPGKTSRGTGLTTHSTAINKSVARVGLNLVMLLSVTAQAAFSVLHIAVGNTGVVVPLTGVATSAIQTVIRATVTTQLLAGTALIDITGV